MTANFDHLVVLMLENRSFDHMLGRLYHSDNPAPYNQPPNGQSFDGVVDGMSNPFIASVPWAPVEFPVSRIPSPDYAAPQDNCVGHQFPDVQMQMYGMAGQPGAMQGFVNDRLIQFKPPHVVTQAELAAVMAGFSPTVTTANGGGPYAACTVLSTLASQFAVCDNWYSSMPGPTFCNRSFLHAGTSNGWTSNSNPWTPRNDNPTIFNALLALQGPNGAKIYHGNGSTEPAYDSLPCLTYYIHPTIPVPIDDTNTIQQFCTDAANGALPSYAFIEPEIIGCDTGNPPNDQHPARDIRYGENLINTVYQAVRNGPLWERTLLVVIYDEHGGFFDHRMPPAVAAPNPAEPPGEDGFTFTSLGVRVPAVLISPWITAGTVFHPTQAVDHTAVIKTLCNRWNLPPLTQRDANAVDLGGVLGTALRPLDDTPVPAFWTPPPIASDDADPLNDLQIDFLALVANSHGLKRPPLLTQGDARRFLKTLPREPAG